SCSERCGESYYRGYSCHCDYECLVHQECCDDYYTQCTTSGSCKGRCGETFKRGRGCHCDSECLQHKQCCPDYENHCTTGLIRLTMSPSSTSTEPASSPEGFSTLQSPLIGEDFAGQARITVTPATESETSPITVTQSSDRKTETSSTPGLQTSTSATDSARADTPKPTDPLIGSIWETVAAVGSDITPLIQTTAHVLPIFTTGQEMVSEEPGSPLFPTLSDDKNETNLCSGRPSDGMTTLQNGTIFVFRGHYFWHLSSNGVAGDARLITDVWGIPSPIDTVFTRCNCQGKTFFFKDKQYWRFENGNMDPGYPKLVSIGFGGMSGTISAALSVPAFRRRRETVYFFKRGGLVQKYSYKQEPPKSCSKTPSKQYSIYNVRTRTARQAVYLSNEINIKLKWKGFPSTITSALSLPNTKKPDGYDYFVFSKGKFSQPDNKHILWFYTIDLYRYIYHVVSMKTIYIFCVACVFGVD
ncbi:PRG4 protein, partial [Amia calva]|nr:PRG4 protein [Amia calva]